MGFWSSLVSKAVDVGHWVGNNSGTILQAAQAIAKVAAVVATEGEKHKFVVDKDTIEDDGGNILPKLVDSVQGAEQTLLTLASQEFPAPPLNTVNNGIGGDQDLDGFVTRYGPFDVSGLWPSPAATKIAGSSAPKVPPNVTADLNKFLKVNRAPVVLGTGSNAIDVGAAISDQIFNSSNAKVMAEYESAGIASSGFNISTKSGDANLMGGMVYYPVPVGNDGRVAWHSHIRGWYISKNQAKQQLEEEARGRSIASVASDPPPGISYNSTTIATRWQGTRNVSDIMTAAVNQFVTNAKGSAGFFSTTVEDGTNFKYQIWSQVTVSSADVRMAFSSAIGQVLNNPQYASQIPRMPDVKIKNVVTYVDDLQRSSGGSNGNMPGANGH